MNNTLDITENFGMLYHPKSALVFYQSNGLDKEVYVEHFDMDKNGTPIPSQSVRQGRSQKPLQLKNRSRPPF